MGLNTPCNEKSFNSERLFNLIAPLSAACREGVKSRPVAVTQSFIHIAIALSMTIDTISYSIYLMANHRTHSGCHDETTGYVCARCFLNTKY